MDNEKELKQLAEAFTEEEISEIAGGEMTPEQRKRLATVLGIAIPTTAVGVTVLGCGLAAVLGKFGEHKDAAHYFTHPFGYDAYGLDKRSGAASTPLTPKDSSKV